MLEHMVMRALQTLSVAAVAGLCAAFVGVVANRTMSAQAPPQRADAASGGLDVVQVRPDFFMIAGAGGNIAVETGPDGTIVVDAGSAERAADVVTTIRRLTSQPIRYVINTGAAADHVG